MPVSKPVPLIVISALVVNVGTKYVPVTAGTGLMVMSLCTVTDPPPNGLVTTTPSRIGVLPEKLTGEIGTVMVSQRSSTPGVDVKPVHLSSGLAEFETTAVPKVATPATAPVTTAPATKPDPEIFIDDAVAPSRTALGTRADGVTIPGAAVTLNKLAKVVAPPLAFVTVADSPPTVAVPGMVSVPKMPFGVTEVTAAVPAVPPTVVLDNVTVAAAKKPVPTMWNGTAVEPAATSSAVAN